MSNTPRPKADDRALRAPTPQARRAAAEAPTLPADSAEPSRPDNPSEAESPASLTSRLPIVDPESYAVDGEVAQGGIGRVLRAEQKSLDRHVALKELLQAGGDAEERFVREARLTARLQHPAIVPIYDAGRWPSGAPFYAMKLVTGRSFDEVIQESRSLDERLALLPHVRAAAEAIAYAHSHRIIHRDLKPANILIGEFGETVVIDWGLGKDLTAEGDPEAPDLHALAGLTDASRPSLEAAPRSADPTPPQSPDSGRPASAKSGRARGASSSGGGLTIAGSILGTPAFMPPEQAAAEVVDERADVYALGAILYHLLAGTPPYQGSTPVQVLRCVKAGPPPPLSARQRGVPHDLLTIVNKAMARDPRDRYRTARELADDLKRFETGQIVRSHSYSTRELLGRFIRRHRALLTVAAAALSLLILVGLISVSRVIKERNLAEAARDMAERSQREAQARADELTLEQARAALERDPNEALAWLKSLSPSFTHWRKARLIAADAFARGVTPVLRGHSNGIISINVSPDGERVATASDDGTARIWDIKTGRSRVLSGHTDEVWCVRFSPDGKLIATSSKDATIRLWDTATGAARVLSAGEGAKEISVVRFLPDGKTLATAEHGGLVRLWDVATGSSRLIGGGARDSMALAVSPDGRRLAHVDGDNMVRVWDLATLERTDLPALTGAMRSVAFSPDGKLLVAGNKDSNVRLWDLERREARVLPGHPKPVQLVAFSPDGKSIASGGVDGTVILWDAASGASRALDGYGAQIKTLAFSPDSALLAAGGDARTVKVWDLARSESRVLRGFKDTVFGLAFTPDSKTLAAASLDHTARLFPLTALRDKILGRHEGEVFDVAFSPAAPVLASAGADKTARIWPLSGGSPIALEGHAGPVSRVVFSSDGERLVTGEANGTARAWDREGRPLHTWKGEAPLVELLASPAGRLVVLTHSDGSVRVGDMDSGETRVATSHSTGRAFAAFSPDGKSFASAGADQIVRLHDVATGSSRELMKAEAYISALAFSPDGKLLAVGGDHFLRFWDLERGEGHSIVTSGPTLQLALPSRTAAFALPFGKISVHRFNVAAGAPTLFEGHTDELVTLTLSRTTGELATASRDNTARLWDPESGESRVLRGHSDDLNSVAFSPDGQLVATAGRDGVVRLWSDDLPFDPAELRARLEAAVPETMGSPPPR
jgi:WD40 repeat protein/serine/threonine protein kinase